MASSSRGLAMLALLLNAFTWGVSWWPLRALAEQGLHPLWLTTLIYGVAVLVLLLVRPRALGELLRTPTLWVLVLAAGLTNACFNWGVTIGDVVRVVLLFYLMPLWAVLLARPILGEHIGWRAGVRLALAVTGAMVVLWPGAAHLGANLGLADALALLGGFSFALNNVMLRREAARSQGARALAMFVGGMVVSASVAAALGQAGGVEAPPAPQVGWVLGMLGLAAWLLVSNLALQYGAARLPAHTTAVVMVSEVFFAAASALALGAGTLTWHTALGGLLIIGAALLAAWQRE